MSCQTFECVDEEVVFRALTCNHNALLEYVFVFQFMLDSNQLKHTFNSTSDTNECEDSEQRCAVNATCINVRGSYNCECKPGFQGNGSINCSGM